jgi:hypothetical protein
MVYVQHRGNEGLFVFDDGLLRSVPETKRLAHKYNVDSETKELGDIAAFLLKLLTFSFPVWIFQRFVGICM